MRNYHKAFVSKTLSVLISGLALTLTGACSLSTTDTSVDESEMTVVDLQPDDLVSSLTYRLTPDDADIFSSGEANPALSIRFEKDSVVMDSSVAIAIVADEATPFGVVQSAYMIAPESTYLDLPARIRIDLPEGTSAEDWANIRIARLDTGNPYYDALPNHAVVPRASGKFTMVAEIQEFGVFALVDTALADTRDVKDFSLVHKGYYAMDYGLLSVAHEAFAEADSSDPTELSAFGLALTSLINLPKLSSFNTFLTACDVPWEPDTVFGTTGFFARDVSRGNELSAEMLISSGFDAQNTMVRPFIPKRTIFELEDSQFCVWNPAPTVIGNGHLSMKIFAANVDEVGSSASVVLDINQFQPFRDTNEGLGNLLSSNDGEIEIPLSRINGRMELTLSSNNTGAVSEDGRFVLDAKSPGSLLFRGGTIAEDEILEVVFQNVLFVPAVSGSVPRVMRLSGTLAASITSPTSTEDISLMATDEDDPLKMLTQCSDLTPDISNDGRGLTNDFFRTMAIEVGAELETIGGLFARAADGSSDEVMKRRFPVSLGLFDSPGTLNIGPAEVHLLSSVAYIVAATSDIFAYYRWWEGSLDVLLDGQADSSEVCDNPCNSYDCQSVTSTSTVFKPSSFVPALNAVILTPYEADADLSGSLFNLLNGIDEIQLALASSALDTPLTPQRGQAGAQSELLDLMLVDISEIVLAETLYDGARFGAFDDFGTVFLFLNSFFMSPPTLDDFRAWAAEADGEASDFYANETLLFLNDDASDWDMAEWPFGAIGHYGDSAEELVCLDASECGTLEGVTCTDEDEDGIKDGIAWCEFPDYSKMSEDELEQAFDPGIEDFINMTILADFMAIFGVMTL
ncbi:hypothetical protein KAI87_01385 [Myxococcota bacterium]|nr:hypothetical protein [Myxococcota bacterium]